MNKRYIFGLIVLSMMLSACSTSGIIPAGNNIYTISSSQDTVFGYSDSARKKVFSNAREFCQKNNRKLKIENFSQSPTTFGKFATATLVFSCK